MIYKRLSKRVLVVLLIVSICFSIPITGTILVNADSAYVGVCINNKVYYDAFTEVNEKDGSYWKWDGTGELELYNCNLNSISWSLKNGLTIVLKGNNVVGHIQRNNFSSLQITGEGLLVTGQIMSETKIINTTLKVDYSKYYGLDTGGDGISGDLIVDNSNLDIIVAQNKKFERAIGICGNTTIKNSNVTIRVVERELDHDYYDARRIAGIDGNNIIIDNSNLSISLFREAIMMTTDLDLSLASESQKSIKITNAKIITENMSIHNDKYNGIVFVGKGKSTTLDRIYSYYDYYDKNLEIKANDQSKVCQPVSTPSAKSGFELGKDNNSFCNSKDEKFTAAGFVGETNYRIEDEYFERLTKYLDEGEYNRMKCKMNDPHIGACHGIAVTMGLLYEGYLKISDLTNSSKSNYYSLDYPSKDIKLLNMINYFHLTQWIRKESTTLSKTCCDDYIVNKMEGYDSLPVFLETLVKQCKDNHVLLFSYGLKSGGNHTILITGCKFDSVKNKYDVEMYDENIIRQKGDTGSFKHMYIDEDFSSFEFEGWDRGLKVNKENYWDLSISDLAEIANIPSGKSSSKDPYTSIDFLAGAGIGFKVEDTKTGKHFIYDGEKLSGNIEVNDLYSISYGETSRMVVDIPRVESLTFSNINGLLDVQVTRDDSFLSLKGESIDNASLVFNEGMTIEGNDFDYDAHVTTDYISTKEKGLLSLSGKSKSKAEILVNGTGLEVRTDGNLANITSKSYIGNDVISNTYSGVSKSFTVDSKANVSSGSIVSSTNPITDKTWKRLSGQGRYDTMKEIVNAGFSETGGTVVIATGTGFKDALAASGLAGLNSAPVVLTDGKMLSPQAKELLSKLKPRKVYIAGGIMAVSSYVESQIKSTVGITPTRIAGQTSAGTSAKLALEGKGKWKDGIAIIATNKTFKDALSVAPISYAKGYPILLADNGKSLSKEVLGALKNIGIKQVIIVGGTSAVTTNVEQQLKDTGISIKTRLWGKTGVATSAAIATWGIQHGLSANKMGVATSQNYPDALSGAALCGYNKSVLLLVDDKAMDNATFPSKYKSKISVAYVFGGTSAVGVKTWNALVNSVK